MIHNNTSTIGSGRRSTSEGPPIPEHVVFRGTVRADGFVFDVDLLGFDESCARVLSLMTDRTVIRALDPTHWLIILETPLTVRNTHAPGLALQRINGRLVSTHTPAIGPGNDDLYLYTAGEWRSFNIASLPIVDPSMWLSFDGFAVTELRAAEQPEVVTTVAHLMPVVEAPDIRKAANLIGRSRRSTQLHDEIARVEAARKLQLDSSSREIRNPSGQGSGRATSTESREQKPKRALFAKILLRTPAAQLFARKHQKYLHDLEKAFDRGDLEEALRNAISVRDAESLGMSLSLPSQRHQLAPTTRTPNCGPSVPWGTDTRTMLRERYRKAAQQLEQKGRFVEAAFVLVDLLGVPVEAVAMLERHQQWTLAAEIAEGHKLEPKLQITLWWRAGNHERAIAIARRHGAFDAAIALVASSDPDSARQLRIQWMRSLTTAGSYREAVVVAWSDESLRSSIAWAIELGITHGGPDADMLRAYRLALRPTAENCTEALELCLNHDPALVTRQEAFLTTLSELRLSDQLIDREISSAAVRSILRSGGGWSERSRVLKVLAALRVRCDPALAADIPYTSFASSVTNTSPIDIRFDRPGSNDVAEVVTLPNGFMLVALGELGTRLLNQHDRVAAQWTVPTDHLVVADHGTKALLLTRRDAVTEVHRLDLVDRRCEHWGTLRIRQWAQTYDGGSWAVVTDEGIELLDVTADRPTVLWRELSAKDVAIDIQRSRSALSVSVDHELPGPETWRWDLPSLTLRSRASRLDGQRPLADGTNVGLYNHPDGRRLFRSAHADGVVHFHYQSTFNEATDFVLTSDNACAVVSAENNDRVAYVYAASASNYLGTIAFGGGLGIRSVAHLLTVFDRTGQVAVFDLERMTLLQVRRMLLQ